MNLNDIYLLGGVLVVAYLLYFYGIFELGDSFLRNSRIKKSHRILIGTFNSIILVCVSTLSWSTDITNYLFYLVIVLIEFLLIYNDKISRIVMIVISYFINTLTVRAIWVAVFSKITGLGISAIAQDDTLFFYSMIVTIMTLNVMLYLVKVIISQELSRAVTEHTEQLAFIISWASVSSLYLLLMNSKIYSLNLTSDYVVNNQIWISLTLLIGYYIVLAFSIMVGESAKIKIKNTELSKTIVNQEQLRASIIHDSLSVYEINLTKDLLIKGFENFGHEIERCNYKFSLLVKILTTTFVFCDDASLFSKYADPQNLLEEYNKGKKELELVYRRMKTDGSHFWVKASAHLYRDNETGDIKALVYIKDYNKEKLQEIELKNKAERDSLTNLYNKGMTESLISDFISAKINKPHKGALFIIDIDNFKMINDNFGHLFGDAVLRDLSLKLKNIFRNSSELGTLDSREDIIGRVGGDEFMIFMKNTRNIELLSEKAENICKAFRNVYQNDNVKVEISCSIGIALFPDNGINFKDLYTSSDIALYSAKAKGKNMYSFYSGEEFDEYESKRGEIESIDSL